MSNNTGINSSGYRNSGGWNSGGYNSGYHNSGSYNSGNCNSGYRNSGNYNSGGYNSGYYNSGNYNSGDWNSGDYNSGFFNTNSPDKIRVFNTWVDMTHEEFLNKYNIYANIPLNRWVNKGDMTDKEKSEVDGWEEMGGYLKTLDFKEACQIWWSDNPDRHDDFTSLPAFNPEIFKEITGIDVNQPETIEINGKKYRREDVDKTLAELEAIDE
jgi:hypothetical protein